MLNWFKDKFEDLQYDIQHFDRAVLEDWRDKLRVAWFWLAGIFIVSLLMKALLPSKWAIAGLFAFLFGASKWLLIVVFVALLLAYAGGFFMKRSKQQTWDADDRKNVDEFLKSGRLKY